MDITESMEEGIKEMDIKQFLRNILPNGAYKVLKTGNLRFKKYRYLIFGRKLVPAETSKAKPRRIKEAFFEKYCRGKGIDIGCGNDKLNANCIGWDFEQGDAQYLSGVPDSRFDFVYSSHTLEHVMDAGVTLRNWWRVLKAGGFMILYIPHRDLYEKKKTLPSRWNKFHMRYFLIDRDENPDTVGVIPLIKRTLSNYEIIYARECSEGHTITDPFIHSDGEHSIEVVIKKL